MIEYQIQEKIKINTEKLRGGIDVYVTGNKLRNRKKQKKSQPHFCLYVEGVEIKILIPYLLTDTLCPVPTENNSFLFNLHFGKSDERMMHKWFCITYHKDFKLNNYEAIKFIWQMLNPATNN